MRKLFFILIFGFLGFTVSAQVTRLKLKQLELAPDTTYRYVIVADTVTKTAYWAKLDSLGLGGGGTSTFYLKGDNGIVQTLSAGDTIEVLSGTGLTTYTISPDQVLLTLDSTGVTAGTYNFASVTVNDQGRITLISGGTEIDGSITNEGMLGVAAGGANDATIYTNTSGNLGTSIAGSWGMLVSETTSANGGTVTLRVDSSQAATQYDISGFVSGSGTSGRVPVFTGAQSIGNGTLRDDGTLLAIGGVTVSGYSFYDYSTGGWRLATGTTAQRPTGQAGGLRYNSTLGLIDWHNGTAWASLAPSAGAFTTGSIAFANSSGQLTQDNSSLYFDDTNNRLGIGTTSPSYPVHITGSNAGPFAIYLKNSSSGSGSAANFIIENNVANRSGQIFKAGTGYGTYKTITANDMGIYNNNSAGNMSFLNDYASGNINFASGGVSTAQLILTSAGYLTLASPGRLGIGTTSPSYPVHITGSNAGPFAIYLKNSSSGSGSAANFIIENDVANRSGQIFKAGTGYGTYKTITANDMGIYNNNSAGNMSFLNDYASGNINFASGGVSTAQLTLSSTGLLGIGATSPAYSLDITSTGGLRMPVGTTAQRPTGAAGVVRYNSTTPCIEYHNGSSWVGVGTGTMSSFTIAGTSGTPQTVSDGQTATIAAGFGLASVAGATRTVTISADSITMATQYDLTQVATIYNADGSINDQRLIDLDYTAGSFNLFWDNGAGDTREFTLGDGASTYTTQDGLWFADYAGTAAGEMQVTSAQTYFANAVGATTSSITVTASGVTMATPTSTKSLGATGAENWDFGSGTKITFVNPGQVGINDTSPEALLDVAGVTKTNQLVGQGSTPSISINANAGTGASTALTGSQSTDLAGRGYITLGTTRSTGVAATMTFATAFSIAPVIQLFPENEDASIMSAYWYATCTTTTCSISLRDASAGNDSRTIEFNYIIVGGK